MLPICFFLGFNDVSTRSGVASLVLLAKLHVHTACGPGEHIKLWVYLNQFSQQLASQV